MKKLFLISMIGLAGYSSNIFTENRQILALINYNIDIDAEIHDAVVKSLEGKSLNMLTLPQVLQELKTNVIKIIEPQVKAGIDRYVKLDDALKSLEPSRLFELRITVKKVMTYMPVKTVQYIANVLKQYGLE